MQHTEGCMSLQDNFGKLFSFKLFSFDFTVVSSTKDFAFAELNDSDNCSFWNGNNLSIFSKSLSDTSWHFFCKKRKYFLQTENRKLFYVCAILTIQIIYLILTDCMQSIHNFLSSRKQRVPPIVGIIRDTSFSLKFIKDFLSISSSNTCTHSLYIYIFYWNIGI